MPGKLSTHALDIHQGKPAAGLALVLHRLDGKGGREAIVTTHTNADGRTDAPLIGPEAMRKGTYEIVFAVGAYFARSGLALPSPPFLDEIPVRFAISDPGANYHVPLLFSPWAYSTYRGS